MTAQELIEAMEKHREFVREQERAMPVVAPRSVIESGWCSVCGGPVVIDMAGCYHCLQCGRRKRLGRVIDMRTTKDGG